MQVRAMQRLEKLLVDHNVGDPDIQLLYVQRVLAKNISVCL